MHLKLTKHITDDSSPRPSKLIKCDVLSSDVM